MTHKQTLCFGQVHRFLDGLFDGDLHAKRVLSLANATLGVISTASLAVNTIGQGLALARGRMTKHAVKQVDRLLSNPGIDVDAALRHWVPHVVGPRTAINVAMDWTEFDADGQATIMLSLMTRHGRATPLVWLTVDKSTLKDRRNEYEYQALVRLADALPADVAVCIVADRGFGDQKLYRVLTEELKFDYVIRFRGNIAVAAADGEVRTAAGWVGPGGRARVLRGASVTAERYKVGSVLCVQDKDMKQAWCLATSTTDASAKALMTLYGKRWSIECGLRDTKDLRFGMGMSAVHVSTPARRDRLWLLNACAIALLTLLGAAGEALGYDRHLKSNTSKTRTHSLFRQGCMLYELIPNMPKTRLQPLSEQFATTLAEQTVFNKAFGVV
ncbi:MAG TPA: IS4 family transposase [Chloroflexota bacterium]|nr:IS4 family transposase [Chloroflexota bacterium]